VGKTEYTVRVEGELWTARGNNAMLPGEKVVITADEGGTLIIRHKENIVKNLNE
jgi:membrane protein implicated in regulation of membrane protease activity